MKAHILMIICLAVSLITFGCDDKRADDGTDQEASAEAPAEDEATAESDKPPTEGAEAEADSELEQVEVAEAGTTFDPAVEAEQLPAGAWYCDMGTVHWAGMDKPEGGNCPECGMQLKQHDPEELAAQKKKAVEAHEHGDHAHGDDDHGHAHGDDDHAHGDDDHAHAHGEDHGHAH